jgi:hypothetical protein
VALAMLILPTAGFGQAANPTGRPTAGDCQPDGAIQLSPAQMKVRLRSVPRISPPELWISLDHVVFVFRVGTGKDGHVTCVQAMRGYPLLIRGVLEAVKTWTFAPTTVDGQPQPTVGKLVLVLSASGHGIETKVLDEEPPTSRGPAPVQDDRK